MDINRRLNLPVPSERVQQLFSISNNILAGGIELTKYAERVPHSESWNIDVLGGPNDRRGLLSYLRTEALPHPEVMWKEVLVREPYFIGNEELREWFYANACGAMEPRDEAERAAGGMITKRCSFCGSSFLGFPLSNHSEHSCGFLRYLSPQYHLEFAIANHHAFCGYCCSRSSRHTSCDRVRACATCQNLGHQQFHGVCDMEEGRDPEAFKRYVLALREKRYTRIQWLYHNRHLGFPLPTDYVPSGVLSNLELIRRSGDRVRGVGPLPPPQAERFEHLPMSFYIGKRYNGLVNPELDNDLLLQQVVLNAEDVRFFEILERRARARYNERRNMGFPQYVRRFFLGRALPWFPDGIYAPGAVRRPLEPPAQIALEGQVDNHAEAEANANAANADADVPMDVPIEQEVPEEQDSLEVSTPNLSSVSMEDQDEGDIKDLLDTFSGLLVTCPPILDTQLFLRLAPVTKASFQQVIEKLRAAQRQLASEKTDKQLFADVEVVYVSKDLEFEHQLRQAVLAEIGQYHLMSAYGYYYSFFVSEPVVTGISTLETPTDSLCLTERIKTWQVLVSGSLDTSTDWVTIPQATKARYLLVLRGIASSIQGQYVFTQLVHPQSLGGSEVNDIPNILVFEDPQVIRSLDALKSANADSIASINVSHTGFPYGTLIREREVGDNTVQEEIIFEMDLRKVIKELNKDTDRYRHRAAIAPLATLKHILAHAIPSSEDALIARTRTIQTALGWYPNQKSTLENMTFAEVKSYTHFLVLIVQMMHGLVAAGKTAFVRESDCILEVIHGESTSFEFIIPTPPLFIAHPFGFWKVWMSHFLIPAAQRVISVSCICSDHNPEVHDAN